MKKIICSVAALALIVSLSAGIGCKKDNPISCTEKIAKMQATATAYVANDSKENCEAYRNALQDYYNSCSSTLSEAEKSQIQTMINDMTCP